MMIVSKAIRRLNMGNQGEHNTVWLLVCTQTVLLASPFYDMWILFHTLVASEAYI